MPVYLADKSALARIVHAAVDERLAPLILDGQIATCPIVDLEVLYSARSFDHYEAVRSERMALTSFPMTEPIAVRALEVQRRLARHGHHRVPLPDLLIAATAEINDATVLHYDSDYDLIADVTGQPVEWVVPRGSL